MSNEVRRKTLQDDLDAWIRGFNKSQKSADPIQRAYKNIITEYMRLCSWFDFANDDPMKKGQDRYNGLNMWRPVMQRNLLSIKDYEWLNREYSPLTKGLYEKREPILIRNNRLLLDKINKDN